MEDSQIIRLYFARDEAAVEQTEEKYGSYCFRLARSILGSDQDAEEVVSDTYLHVWNAILRPGPRCCGCIWPESPGICLSPAGGLKPPKSGAAGRWIWCWRS